LSFKLRVYTGFIAVEYSFISLITMNRNEFNE
jgi:hypothetical protein